MFETIVTQDIQLPDKISISDKFFSPWCINLLYEYELKLNADYYTIRARAIKENGKNKNKNKKFGTIDKKLIENILLTIKQQPTKEIEARDFKNQFTLDNISNFFKKEGDNYWITIEHQK